MKKIENCTLLSIDCYNYGSAVTALKKSMEQNEFEQVIFFTDIPLKIPGIEVIQIPTIASKNDYSRFVMKVLWRYITTSFTLTVQHDGYTLNGDLFDEKLYDFDYAGALWINEAGYENGNGGYSWKSKRLLHAIGTDDLIRATNPEDAQICRTYRDYLEKTYKLKWATDEICEGFSFELRAPEKPTMGFHNYFHAPYQPIIIIKRTAAMGDCIQVEPLLEYFHNKGYRVVLDTLPQFQMLFIQHYFPVLFPHQVEQRILDTAKVVNLDMSYESNPQQLHLKTYFEYAGVEDYKLRNPKLALGFDLTEDKKLFKKYCILHTDRRGQASRNAEGLDWYKIVQHLISKGYEVIHLGKGAHIKITGAIEVNPINENMLAYIVAGASLMVGIDSGISHIASGFNVPSILFFGSVNPEFIHPDLSNIIPITNHNKENPICNKAYCWHSEITTVGVSCYIDNENPPCNKFKTSEVINAINKLIN